MSSVFGQWAAALCLCLCLALAPRPAQAQEGQPEPEEAAAAGAQVRVVIELEAAAAGASAALAFAAAEQRALGLDLHLAPGARETQLTTVGTGAQGIFGINQDAGLANQQGNLAAIALAGGDGGAGAALALPTLSQEARDLRVTRAPGAESNRIEGAFNNAHGLVQINQASGAGNLQANLLALAFAAGAEGEGALALGDAALSQTAAGAELLETGPLEGRNLVLASFENFSGVAQIHQTAGSLNLVANSVSVSFGGAP